MASIGKRIFLVQLSPGSLSMQATRAGTPSAGRFLMSAVFFSGLRYRSPMPSLIASLSHVLCVGQELVHIPPRGSVPMRRRLRGHLRGRRRRDILERGVHRLCQPMLDRIRMEGSTLSRPSCVCSTNPKTKHGLGGDFLFSQTCLCGTCLRFHGNVA